MVAYHYLLVQRWRPNFINRAKKESKVVVWIMIPELALELYNLKFFTRLGSSLGNFLKMGLQPFITEGSSHAFVWNLISIKL